jgi:hypothetical protein
MDLEGKSGVSDPSPSDVRMFLFGLGTTFKGDIQKEGKEHACQ